MVLSAFACVVVERVWGARLCLFDDWEWSLYSSAKWQIYIGEMVFQNGVRHKYFDHVRLSCTRINLLVNNLLSLPVLFPCLLRPRRRSKSSGYRFALSAPGSAINVSSSPIYETRSLITILSRS